MKFELSTLEDTLDLGKILGQAVSNGFAKGISAIYLWGGLGAGKTTFTRGFVSALPGAEEAEVASPSFTICHEYPTQPVVFHADFYRMPANSDMPEDLAMTEDSLLLLEWPENLAKEYYAAERLDLQLTPLKNPAENLDIFVNSCEEKRLAVLTAQGTFGKIFLQAVQDRIASRFKIV